MLRECIGLLSETLRFVKDSKSLLMNSESNEIMFTHFHFLIMYLSFVIFRNLYNSGYYTFQIYNYISEIYEIYFRVKPNLDSEWGNSEILFDVQGGSMEFIKGMHTGLRPRYSPASTTS